MSGPLLAVVERAGLGDNNVPVCWLGISKVWICDGSKIPSGWLIGFSGGGAGNASGTSRKTMSKTNSGLL
ncbi:hypothetical protein Tco_0825924, partial [Tanacetum coccineum]